jgi:hypothetical protein
MTFDLLRINNSRRRPAYGRFDLRCELFCVAWRTRLAAYILFSFA